MGNRQRIAVVSVINDLVSDGRVIKIADTLLESDYQVIVIGRLLPHSPPLPDWNYKAIRMRLWFKTGPLFYLFFQLRLFIKLLFTRTDLLYANDLDTLLPNFLISRLKRIPIVYDSHELFCEVPELKNTKLKKRLWESLERWLVPKVKHRITVNESIAEFFLKKYGTRFEVVRNIPAPFSNTKKLTRADLDLPEHIPILIMQGAGINIDRGAEELVESLKYLDDVLLLIIGSGDVWPRLEGLQKTIPENKLKLIKRLPKDQLIQYTLNADLGISIDKGNNLNYLYSLPNKLFDYIQCGLPVLVSKLPEIERIVNTYKVGEFIPDHRPEQIAISIKHLLTGGRLSEYKKNAGRAADQLTWTKEQESLKGVINRASRE